MDASPRELRCFRQVAHHGSFTAAAAALDLAQPAVSAAIRSLERRVGVRLFDRTTRQVRLTEAGGVLLDAVSAGLDRIDAGFAAVTDLAAGRAGRVRLGAPPVLAAAWLPRVIDRLHRDTPHIRIDLTDGASDRLRAALRAGSLDLAIGTFPDDGRADGVQLREVMADRLMLVLPPGDPWAGRARVGWAEVAGRPMVLAGPANGIRPLIDRAAAIAGVRLTAAQTVTQIATVLALVRGGLGPGIVPGHALDLAADLTALALVDPVAKQPIHLARPADRSPTPATRSVERLLLDLVRRLPAT